MKQQSNSPEYRLSRDATGDNTCSSQQRAELQITEVACR